MKPDRERLKELKRIVENEFEVFNEKIQHFCITPIGRDLLALIDAALAEPKNNFEKWKAELTIDKLPNMLNYSCMGCPLRDKCQKVAFRMSKPCRELIKEWGESCD